MFSPWQLPVPLGEHTTIRVTVYFFWDSQWVPIKFCTLDKAVQLSYKALSLGKEIFLFPVDLDPNDFYSSREVA
ncbi:hypothetical protein I8751_04145 [Nostocaceae cyanobacterium CENA357]|uniref:Uncharacterized protein n=1 Tax=Atlanticothrix silvestris CENA357 TaxID=1725252 RepID=A0A8J7H8I3_9CYAN|nr:hypothetical protein [Atlanticothrix silvestris]MBH8551579.1 hypothetical protein [Atlanticothrix silvestris CENA357]